MKTEILDYEVERLVKEIKYCRTKALKGDTRGRIEKIFLPKLDSIPIYKNAIIGDYWHDLTMLLDMAYTSAAYDGCWERIEVKTEETLGDNIEAVEDCGYYCCIDVECLENKLPKVEKMLTVMATAVGKTKNSRLIIALSVPNFPPVPNGVKILEERELSYYLEKEIETAKMTHAVKNFIEIERICRRLMIVANCRISILRFPNLFGLWCKDSVHTSFYSNFSEVFAKNKIEYISTNFQTVRSSIYIPYAVRFMISALYSLKTGNVYNVCADESSMLDDLVLLYKNNSGDLNLNVVVDCPEEYLYNVIGSTKHAVAEFRYREGRRKRLAGFYSYYKSLFTERQTAIHKLWQIIQEELIGG
jgi:hypothetical protein